MIGQTLAHSEDSTAVRTEVGWRGVTLARRGERDAAIRVEQQLSQWEQPYLKGRDTLWRARIAAVMDDATRLEAGEPRWGSAFVGWTSILFVITGRSRPRVEKQRQNIYKRLSQRELTGCRV